jgi:2'-aminobiphenyl-2,3-diol 1,2-dioxygenase, large subunit
MAKIVAAFGMSHLLLDAGETEEERNAVFYGNKEIGECVRAQDPDILLVIAGDHKFNELESSWGVCVADEYTPCGDLGNPKSPFKGHSEFAQGLLTYANEHGFSLSAIGDDFKPDHSFGIPVMFTTPNGRIPVVQLVVFVSDVPEPEASYRYGEIVKEYITTQRPDDERVAIIASGGLSHWVFDEDPLMEFEPGPNMTQPGVNVEFDMEVLDCFTNGKAKEFAEKWNNKEILDKAGNGALELSYWLMMAATLPGHKGRKIYYEPLSAWGTGMGAIEIFP